MRVHLRNAFSSAAVAWMGSRIAVLLLALQLIAGNLSRAEGLRLLNNVDVVIDTRAAATSSPPTCYQDLARLADNATSWLVQANADYDSQMTESKCLHLCAAKRVLPIIVLQNLGACYCAKALPENLGSIATKLPLPACVSGPGCPGNRSVSCGSSAAALVIDTSHGLTPVPAPPPAPGLARLPLLPYPRAVSVLGSTRVLTPLTNKSRSATRVTAVQCRDWSTGACFTYQVSALGTHQSYG